MISGTSHALSPEQNIKVEQIAAIRACMTGKDSIVALPTGFGKSLCFQLIPTLAKGTVIIISPLIALAADQVRSLKERGYTAAMFRGRRRLGIKQDNNWQVWKDFRDGKLQYCASTSICKVFH